jgi:hypothetical protein
MLIGAGVMFCILAYVGWLESKKEEHEAPKGKTIQDLSDDELKVVALSFIHDITKEIEKREKNERGEMQEEKKPFEEFNGKE